MHALRRLFCTATLLGLASLAAPVLASSAAPKDGVEYKTLPSPQPTDAGPRKIEVIEFFAYYCPHCYAFEPLLAEWVRKQGDAIVFKRVHVPRDAGVLPQQRLFYTLESLGLLEQYHAKAFAAMHVERLRLASDEQVFDWAARAGIDRARFIETYRSFGVQAKLRRAATLMQDYGVTHWPMLAVDGRFLTSPGMVAEGAEGGQSETQLFQGTLQVMDQLVAKAKAGKQ
ncbi:thiol:disulfide interchange protein DsbA/DsbL [Massilia sp. ST3]|uniref:thiol:disulfide interchange protein DsbA/DsbL n=1 Tax=Massilia sp. ST3 TaxID=2824903 RepID=UPI001B82BEB9|nr:thiol:disulfide interchange protein DsbA/DsbL [Massilia sp. ST3]MBQ5950486.1 thiol:disulfide interchange protein DsbA/DsbL [Massilia sp. ST3]